jgi:hypothetical protein
MYKRKIMLNWNRQLGKACSKTRTILKNFKFILQHTIQRDFNTKKVPNLPI